MSNALCSAYFVFNVPITMRPPFPPEIVEEFGPVRVERSGSREADGRMNYCADVWGIRVLDLCWSRSGGWEHETNPSDRDSEWLRDHRFTFAEAADLLEIRGTTNGPV